MNGWWCECCIDHYCDCQGVDLIPQTHGSELDVLCFCCLGSECKCAGQKVYP